MLTASPWIQAADPIRAAQAGASLGIENSRLGLDRQRVGLEASRINQAQNDALDRIQLGYAELGQHGQQAEADRALRAQQIGAELTAAAQQHALENLFRDRTVTTEEQNARTAQDRLAQAEAKGLLPHPSQFKVIGNGGYLFNPNDNSLQTLVSPNSKENTNFLLLQYRNLSTQVNRMKSDTLGNLTKGPQIKAQVDAAEKAMRDIEGRLKGMGVPVNESSPVEESPSPGASLSSPFSAPSLAMPPQSSFGDLLNPGAGAGLGLPSLGTSPAVSAPSNPYRVGGNYGGLIYRGGDPNDENSWEKAK